MSRRGTRFEAFEVLRQAVHHSFGEFKQGIADKKLALRRDHGSQFIINIYKKELKLLRIKSAPSFVVEPQCNGVTERFIRTLKEHLLWLKSFSSVAQLNEELSAFKVRYNNTWIVAKHYYLTPSEARTQLTSSPYSSEAPSRAS